MHLMRSQKRADCRPGRFRLQAVIPTVRPSRPHVHHFPNKAADTPTDVRRHIRESLGLAVQAEPRPTVPVEAHLCEYPIWAYSKQSTTITRLQIDYEDGSFVDIRAPEGFPSMTSPGYLDVLLHQGQRDLFREPYVEMSVYSILG
jgi:hypothetical protein